MFTRETSAQMDKSSYLAVTDMTERMKLPGFHETQKIIRYQRTGSTIGFMGLLGSTKAQTKTRIKSLEGYDYLIVEEAENVSLQIVKNLHDTVRGEGRKIIYIYNPHEEDNALERYYKNSNQVLRIHLNYTENVDCPQDIIDKAEEIKKEDYAEYEHVYLGGYKRIGSELIYGGKYRVEEFDTPKQITLYHGIDWGFANSWTTCLRCFIKKNDTGKECIYVDHAYGGPDIDIGEDTAELFDNIPTMREWESIADSARPESISAMRKQGFRIKATKKGQGSVEDGIKHIKSYKEIVIHPRCVEGKKNILTDCKNYKYKTDPLTGDVIPVIIKKNDDFLDALRYSLEGVMRKKTNGNRINFLVG